MEKRIITIRDNVFTVPDNQEVFLLEHIKSASARPTLNIKIGKNARVQYVCIIESYGDGDIKQKRVIDIADGAQVEGYQAYFGQGSSEFHIDNNLGNKSVLNNQVLFYKNKEQHFKVQDNYTFQGRGASGNFRVVGLADDQANIQYYSEIIIKAQAQLTDSRIDMQLHLLSSQAKGKLIPGLKIDANEVKAGHSASTFQLSLEDLFYLRSRGLTEKQIKSLIIDSLASKFTKGISDEDGREVILSLIKERVIL